MNVTLKNLKNRIALDTTLLEKHPENREQLERKIAETKELIVKAVMQSNNDYILDQIIL